MADDIGWRYLSSDGSVLDDENANSLNNMRYSDGSGTFRNAEGSRESIFSDGSGYFYGADGSRGTKYSDGGAYYRGADGSYGTRFSDGSAYYHRKDGSYCQRFSDGSVTYRDASGSTHFYYSGDERIDSIYREKDDSDEKDTNRQSFSGGVLLGILGALAFGGSSVTDTSVYAGSGDDCGLSDNDIKDIYDPLDYELDTKDPNFSLDLNDPVDYEFDADDFSISLDLDENNEELLEERYKSDQGINTQHIGIIKRLLDKLFGKKAIAGISSELCKGKKYYDIEKYLRTRGFYNIGIETVEDLTTNNKMKEGCVEEVFFGDTSVFGQECLFRIDSKVRIVYHTMKMSNPPYTSGSSKKTDYKLVYNEFVKAGFENVKCEPVYDLIFGLFNRLGNVERVMISGKKTFSKKQRIRVDTPIIIRYHSFDKCKKA